MEPVKSSISRPETSGTRPIASLAAAAAASSEPSPRLLSDHHDDIGPASPSSEPTPAPDPVAVLRQEAQEKFGQLGQTIAEAFPTAVLNAVSGATFGGAVNPGGFKAYLDSLLVAAGNPSDPVETMLVQQLIWAHHQVGNLAGKAAHPATLQEVEVYNQALARIMAEFRRSSLALREYRSGPSPKQITVVKQQNVAAGNQNVALVDGKLDKPVEKDRNIELRTKQALLNYVEFPDNPFATTDRRTPEPVEAQRPHTGRPRKAPAGSPGPPPLEVFDGPDDADGQSDVSGQWQGPPKGSHVRARGSGGDR
jgi:hypothetical protein